MRRSYPRAGSDQTRLYAPPVRAMFVFYAVVISAGIAFYVVVGLTHH
jgi:hypothetical protein